MGNVRERSRQRTDELIAFLKDNITSGAWGPGYRLPTEQSLVSQFSAPRNTVRKALSSLESEGLIDRHVGRGTFVLRQDPAKPGGDRVDVSPAEINDIRILIEPAIAELVVARATTSNLNRIRECYHNSLKSKTIEDYEHWDSELHSAIIQASGSKLLITMYDSIREARHQIHWFEIKRQTLDDDQRCSYDNEHFRIVEAVLARDARALRAALTDHLNTVSNNMLNT